jgi:phage tail tape-measure protein
VTGAERAKRWRDKKRGKPPRPYHKKRELKGVRQYGGPSANAARAAAIKAAWDDPLRRALMSRIKLEGK